MGRDHQKEDKDMYACAVATSCYARGVVFVLGQLEEVDAERALNFHNAHREKPLKQNLSIDSTSISTHTMIT